MISTKRFPLLLAVAGVVTLGSSASAWAQVVVPYPPYPYYSVYAESSLRLEVTPKEAEVYVDGYYAGIVDDFDGVFQRLHTTPGQHEIIVYLDGYRRFSQRVYLMPNNTLDIKERLEKLGPGDAVEPRPTPPPVTEPIPSQGPPFPRRGGPEGRGGRGNAPTTQEPPETNGQAEGPPPGGQVAVGTLSIQLQPTEVDVLIDGQPWPGAQSNRLVIDLPEGRHVVQVRKSGYVGYLTEVDVHRGETTTLTVNLRMQP